MREALVGRVGGGVVRGRRTVGGRCGRRRPARQCKFMGRLCARRGGCGGWQANVIGGEVALSAGPVATEGEEVACALRVAERWLGGGCGAGRGGA